jgi:catechol 2,3-dioxygenase-like lactoylglutathione lyase family enzyme
MQSGAPVHTDGRPVRLHHIVVDAHDLPRLARFWTQALGWKILAEREREIVIGTDENAPVGMCFMPVTGPKTVKNGVHLDLTSSPQDRDQEIERLLVLGARRVDIGQNWRGVLDCPGRPGGKRVLRDTPEGHAHPVRLRILHRDNDSATRRPRRRIWLKSALIMPGIGSIMWEGLTTPDWEVTMFRRILIAALAAATLPALAAAAPAPPAAASPGVTVATGTIVNATGHALAGVPVDLYAWPSDTVLRGLRPGQAVPTKLLASTTTSSTGSYALTVPQTALRAAAIEQGWANLEIDSVSGASWSFSYQTDPAAAEQANLTAANPGICHTVTASPWQYLRQLRKAWGVVGQGYIVRGKHTKGDYVSFTYKQGQSSALGLGVSVKGYDVGYSAEGTEKEWTTDVQGFPSRHHNAWFRTLFRVALYRQLCVQDGGGRRHQKGTCPKKDENGGHVVYCIWKARSNGWAGGDSILFPRRAPKTPSFDCVPQLKSSHFDRDHGTAVTWSKGFEMAAPDGIGFNGQAQTGYDTNGHMAFRFNTKGWLCGTNALPPTAAQMVARGSAS